MNGLPRHAGIWRARCSERFSVPSPLSNRAWSRPALGFSRGVEIRDVLTALSCSRGTAVVLLHNFKLAARYCDHLARCERGGNDLVLASRTLLLRFSVRVCVTRWVDRTITVQYSLVS